MVRMSLGPNVALGPVGHRLLHLGPSDVPAIESLIAQSGSFAPDGFASYQVADGLFFGIADDCGGLAAVGGTHILNTEEGVAAIGNVCTHPDFRGRGYAKAITTEIVSQLRSAGVPVIVLNVIHENRTARRLYESLGFVEHCSFVEGIVARRRSTFLCRSEYSRR
jgi:ribosomal protein S18 acetylase RimI-like enzyme